MWQQFDLTTFYPAHTRSHATAAAATLKARPTRCPRSHADEALLDIGGGAAHNDRNINRVKPSML